MDIKQLTTYFSLAHTLSYQKSAVILQYSPSTLFKHIQLLEQELGVPLFCKDGRQLCMTPQGQSFYEHAKLILEQYEQAMTSLCDEDAAVNTMTVGGCEINMGNSLLNLLSGFYREYPNISINMKTSPNIDVPAMVREDMVDIGFFYSVKEPRFPGLHTVCLYQEPVYIITAKKHPLAQKNHVSYDDLNGMTFAYPHDSCCFIVETMERLKSHNVCLGKTTYLGGMNLVVDCIQKENALSLIPARALERFENVYDMVRLNLNDEPIRAWETVVYKNKETLNPSAQKLLKYSIRYAQTTLLTEYA